MVKKKVSTKKLPELLIKLNTGSGASKHSSKCWCCNKKVQSFSAISNTAVGIQAVVCRKCFNNSLQMILSCLGECRIGFDSWDGMYNSLHDMLRHNERKSKIQNAKQQNGN